MDWDSSVMNCKKIFVTNQKKNKNKKKAQQKTKQ